MRHRRIKRVTMGKDYRKMSRTLVSTIGQGTAGITKLEIYKTAVTVARTLAGATLTTNEGGNTANLVEIGNIIKYIHVCLQAGSRQVTGDVPIPDDSGWIEYALVTQREQQVDPVKTNIGTSTLGDLCVKQFRGDCIFTGCIPVASSIPTSIDLMFKLPKKAVKVQIGSNLNFYYHFRSVNVADVRTDSHRVLGSSMYKVYY